MDMNTNKLTKEEKLQKNIAKFKDILNVVKINKWKLIIINFVVLVLALVYLFFIAELAYDSAITILPEYGSKNTLLGQFGDIAAMAGIKVGEGSPTEIYKNLILSEAVLEPVIYHKYRTLEYKDSVNLIEYFDVSPDKKLDPESQKRKMFLLVLKELITSRIDANVERLTKILTVRVTMPESKLSADVVNQIAKSLDNYIRTKRKSFASEQRIYIEKRIEQIRDSLEKSENKLRDFREQNRIVAQSPALMLEQSRLVRTVEILQTVFVELTKQLELAKIDEIKDTPIINIKEFAREPIVRTSPKRLYSLVIIMLVSVLLSVSFFIFKPKIDLIVKSLKGNKA